MCNTGKRSDFLFSPAMRVLNMYGVDMQSFALDPTEKHLITVGVGLNSDKYKVSMISFAFENTRTALIYV